MPAASFVMGPVGTGRYVTVRGCLLAGMGEGLG